MKNIFKAFTLGLSLLFATVSVCSAQDFQKGLAAAQKGDYATALKEWRPLADQGDAEAQYNLGVMYERGQGVTQDYKEAARLYGLAAAQGDADAQGNLDALNKSITATAADNATPAVAPQGASDAYIRRTALTSALGYLVLSTFLSFLIFRFTAYRYWKKVRVTAIQNGIWCGGILASMAPYGVMNKMVSDGFSEIPGQLVVTTFLFFTLAFACGYAWRKFKAVPNPAKPNNEEFASDPALRQQILDVAKDKDQLEIKPKRPVDDIEAAPNPAQAHSEETKVGLSGEIKMNALLLRPSLLAGVAGFLVPILMKPYGKFPLSFPLSTWFDKGDGLIMCFAGAIAAFALVEMYQRLRKP